jgi:spermidine synthase
MINHPLYKGNIPYVNYFLLTTLINPNIKKVLLLGMGTGNLVNNLIHLIPNLQKIDIVEIDPDIVEIAKDYFDFKPDNRVNINIQDARVFVRNAKTKYDLIILDIFSSAGMSYRLVTEEFLKEISDLLGANGILTSNISSLSIIEAKNNVVFKSLLKTYSSVFTNTLVFPTIHGNEELYKNLMKLNHPPHITNVVTISSNSDLLSKKMLIDRAIEDNIAIVKYAHDLHDEEIDLSGLMGFKDAFEDDADFNPNDITNYHQD